MNLADVLDQRVRCHLRARDGSDEWHGKVVFFEVRYRQGARQIPSGADTWPYKCYQATQPLEWEVVLRGIGPLTKTVTAELDALPEISIIPETRGGETAT